MNKKEIKYFGVSEIIPYENNPRINDEAVEFVINSIKKFGFQNPIIIDENNVIVCGHTRLKAAKELGFSEVPCVVASELSPEQIKAFRIADNSTAAVAQWDMPKLEIELKDIEFDMDQFGLNFEAKIEADDGENDGAANKNNDDNNLPNQKIIKYKKTIIPYSDSEEYLLDKAINNYISANGTLIGFWDAILRGGPYDN